MLAAMAREASNREDLLREATALVERIELVPLDADGRPSADLAATSPIIAGFRRDGALSIFFGADPVYQFNAAGELRRAYVNGLLYKSADRRLVSLGSKRTEREVQLVRHDVSDNEQHLFLNNMARSLRELEDLLATHRFEVTGQVPPNADILLRLRTTLASLQPATIADRPNA